VHSSFDADTFFPEINLQEWELSETVFHTKDEKHLFDFTYQTYIRKSKN
jgi:dihydrofolate reductase